MYGHILKNSCVFLLLESQTLHLQVLQVSLQILNMQTVRELMIQILHRQLRLQVCAAHGHFLEAEKWSQSTSTEDKHAKVGRKTSGETNAAPPSGKT